MWVGGWVHACCSPFCMRFAGCNARGNAAQAESEERGTWQESNPGRNPRNVAPSSPLQQATTSYPQARARGRNSARVLSPHTQAWPLRAALRMLYIHSRTQLRLILHRQLPKTHSTHNVRAAGSWTHALPHAAHISNSFSSSGGASLSPCRPGTQPSTEGRRRPPLKPKCAEPCPVVQAGSRAAAVRWTRAAGAARSKTGLPTLHRGARGGGGGAPACGCAP